MSWKDLCGEHILKAIRTDVRHPFDADASGVALYLDDMTVFVFEDPCDGYRSSAVDPMIVNAPMYSFGVNPDYIRVPVRISLWTKEKDYHGESEGIKVVDRRNGLVILTLGTSDSDDYYPSFVCDWRPGNIAENAETE